MNKILMMLRHHWQEDFHRKAYFSLLLFLSVSLCLNYYFDFEDEYVDRVSDAWKIPAKFLWFAFPYITASFIVLPFYGKREILKKKTFWIPALFILLCLGFDSGFPVYQWLVKDNFPYQVQLWIAKIFRDLINIPFILIPVFIFYIIRKEKSNFYGLTAPFDPKPYLILLLLMLPLLFTASLLDNFNSFYPMYKESPASVFWNIPEKWMILIYEIIYGWNFLSIEFVFRGFLVIGMTKVLGRQAILPMVAVYCFYHFGKPAGEAISSIFGGYILGVIAYETRSIFGGVILHVGVAWTMEMLGFFA
jgi:hypothetical protein